MGSLQAMEMRKRLALDQALRWHLAHNHYPPIPLCWLPIAKQVIEKANESYAETGFVDFDDLVFDNPVRPGQTMSALRVYEGLHLEFWVGGEDEV